MRIFLSFNAKDAALAEALRVGLGKIEPTLQVSFSRISLGTGVWLPKLADRIAEADAFLLLIGPAGVGRSQQVEYHTALDRHFEDGGFALVPVLAAGGAAPGLPFLRDLNWVGAPVVTDDDILHRIVAALNGETTVTATPLWKLVNPYRGLEAMTEADADYFHGRMVETAMVLRALAYNPKRCPVLIGASGVGKSSVAQAGVLSALKSMQWPGADASAPWPAGLQNSREWVSIRMRPGDAPLEALTAAVTRLWRLNAKDPDPASRPRQWMQRLASGDNTLADLVGAAQEELRRREGEAPARILLYVDQAEELYTRADPNESRRFSRVLTEGLKDGRLLAFASLRADTFDRLLADEALSNAYEQVNVAPLDRARLHAVVTAPASALGVGFADDRLADQITDAAAATADALPHLSYLLTDAWESMIKRGDATLRLTAQAMDVGRVLANRAEEFIKANPDREHVLRRLLSLKLAAVPLAGEPRRRQAGRAECTDAEWELAVRLADHPWRFVALREREADGQIFAEMAHEALLRVWPRLRDWLREEREFLVFKGEMERLERRWRELYRADKALLAGLDLARAEDLLPKRSDDLSPEVAAFAQRSIAAGRTRKQRQLRLQERLSLGAVAAAVLMTVIGGFAWVRWGEAARARDSAAAARQEALSERDHASAARQQALSERDNAAAATARASGERDRADAERKQAQAKESLFLAGLARQQRAQGDAGTAMLLALEALPAIGAVVARPDVPEARHQLDAAAQALRERIVFKGHADRVRSAAFSPDGKRIVTASADKAARLWDAASGNPIGEPLKGHVDAVTDAAFSPDGKRIVTASADKTARLWDAASGKPIGEAFEGHADHVLSAAFSPDGKRILTASEDKTARLWDAETATPVGNPLAGHAGAVRSAAFSPDGKRILTASDDDTARLWDAETGKPIGDPLKGHAGAVLSAAFSPDGKRILTASDDQTVRLWDAGTGAPIGEPLKGHNGPVQSAAFSPDGTRIVTASDDLTVRLWDAQTGKPIGGPLKGHEDMVRSAAFSPDGRRIVTASEDRTARLWDAQPGEPIGEPLADREDSVGSVALSPDGRDATVSREETARRWKNSADIAEMVAHARATAPRCLSPALRREFFLSPEPPVWCIELEKWPYHTPAWKDWLGDLRAGKPRPLPPE